MSIVLLSAQDVRIFLFVVPGIQVKIVSHIQNNQKNENGSNLW